MSNSIIPFSTARLRISEIDFCGWLGQATPGDCLEYHRGFLALDGIPMATRLPPKDRTELLKLGRRAMWAAEQGLAHLVQRRHGPDDFSYLAVARRKPKSSPVSLSALLAEEVA
jgi:hypothetical protein